MRSSLEALSSASTVFLGPTGPQAEIARLFPPLPDGKPIVPIDNVMFVHSSLCQFVKMTNSGDVARQLVQARAKNGATFPDDNFYVIARQKIGHQQIIDDKNGSPYYPLRGFFQDGSHGLTLMWKTKRSKNPSWLEVVSFLSSLQLQMGRYSDTTNFTRLAFPEPAPVIVQIQGYPTHEKRTPWRTRTKILALQRDFFMDVAVVELLIEWCVRNRMPTLYMLPASMNKYLNANLPAEEYEKRKKIFEIRYDCVARHFGFTHEPNGLWGLDLRPIRLANGA